MRKKRNTLLRLGPFFNLFYDVFLSYLTVHEAVSEKLGLLSKGYPVEHESDNYVTRGVEQLQSATEFAPKLPFLCVQ